MDLIKLVEKKKNWIREISKNHGASNLMLFGSVSRGDYSKDSDLDLLVTMEKGRSLLDHAALILDLEKELGVKVDVVTESGLRKRIKEKVLKEAIPL